MINPNLEEDLSNNSELEPFFAPSLAENPLSLEIEPSKNGLYLDPFSQEEELLASEEAIEKSQTEFDSILFPLNPFSSDLALPQKGEAIRSRSLTTQELTGAEANNLITVKPESLEPTVNRAQELTSEPSLEAIALDLESGNSTTSMVEMVDTSSASAEVNVKVNFQPDTYETPAGYIADSGLIYSQQDGYTFGWNESHEGFLRDRSGFNNDPRLASHATLKAGALWEMEVPNGKYHVRVATGEAKFSTKNNTINIEGKNYWDFQYLNKNEFGYINAQIEVTDGRLSIDNGSAPQKTTKIAYLEITDDVTPDRSPDIEMKFNFQAASVATPDNYIRDRGDLYGSRDGGTFGWNIDHTDYGRDRTGYNTDSRRASHVVMKPGAVWEVALPNGEYHVSVTIGDARYSASNNIINVEDSNYWTDLSLDANQFATKVRTVSVNDGKLTIDNGNATDRGTKIAYLHITSGDAPIEYDFPSDIRQLPLQPGHPDPFLNLLKDERLPSVSTTTEWEAHRDYLKQLSAFYQYGIMPPKPETYRVMSQSTRSIFGNAAVEDLYKITLERNGLEQSFEYGVIRPNREHSLEYQTPVSLKPLIGM
ncbi:MAG: hypothetical protein QNJ41_11420 [Xenococcaceae cyanobacterium MO_188.B32]|nr:hypothetical protein [Xenococcaceae cyanobacterium MO_188.B32]